MVKEIESMLRNYPRPYITDGELERLLEGTRDSRYGKVKRWLAQNKLLHMRRGLYCLTEAMGYFIKPHPFEIAQHVYGPSYISLESALSFHKLIPETVHSVTSVTSKRANKFQTPLGLFDYLHLPRENFYTEVIHIAENTYQFFMAKPWKAICDYIFCYKKNWKNIKPLLENLRINHDDLPILSNEKIMLLDEYYRHKRVSNFLKGIKRDLSL